MKSDTIQFYTINLASFFSQLAIAMINLTLVYHLRYHYDLPSAMIGLAAAMSPTSYLLSCLVKGRLPSNLRPRHAIMLSLAGMGTSILVLLSVHNLAVTYLCLFLYGMWMSFLWPHVEEWFSRGKEGEALSRAANGFNVSWSLGVAISSYLAGLLIERSTILAFLVSISFFVVVFVGIWVVSILVPAIRMVPGETTHIETSQLSDRSTPLRFYAWIGIVVLYGGMSIILTIFPLYAHEELLLRESHVGLLLLIRGITSCISFYLLGRFSFWHFKKSLIFLVQALFALLCFSALRFSSLLFYGIFFLLFGVLFSFAYTQSIFHGSSGAIRRSERMIIHEILLTIGIILGSIGGGWFYQKFGFTNVLLAVGTLGAIAVGGELIISIYIRTRIRYNGA
jgi:DHA1 family multidrug resistance protein-like MFS transporter/DHA1 family quinolone resistance protein-like MFS transporter